METTLASVSQARAATQTSLGMVGRNKEKYDTSSVTVSGLSDRRAEAVVRAFSLGKPAKCVVEGKPAYPYSTGSNERVVG